MCKKNLIMVILWKTKEKKKQMTIQLWRKNTTNVLGQKKKKRRVKVSLKSGNYSKANPQDHNIGSNLIQAGLKKNL